MKNPVAKYMNEFNKPRTFRDRKKHPSKAQQRAEAAARIGETPHPKHAPYKRCPTNLHNYLLDDDNDN